MERRRLLCLSHGSYGLVPFVMMFPRGERAAETTKRRQNVFAHSAIDLGRIHCGLLNREFGIGVIGQVVFTGLGYTRGIQIYTGGRSNPLPCCAARLTKESALAGGALKCRIRAGGPNAVWSRRAYCPLITINLQMNGLWSASRQPKTLP